MSNDAELLKALRQASIDYSTLQLRLLHDYKESLNRLYGAPSTKISILRNEKKGKGKASNKGKKGASDGEQTYSDLVFDLTRTSVLAWEQWLRVGSKQLDIALGLLRRSSGSSPGLGDVDLSSSIAGNTAKMNFRVHNPYPFEAKVSFDTLSLKPKGGDPIHPKAQFKRTDGHKGDEFVLAPNEEGEFELVIDMAGHAAHGPLTGDCQVRLENSVVGKLNVKLPGHRAAKRTNANKHKQAKKKKK